MALRITFDMFSGRPNPSVIIEGHEAKEVLERLKPDKRLERKEAAPPPESILGYRGLRIEQLGRPVKGLPSAFRVVGSRLHGAKLAHRPVDAFVEDFVCGSTGPIRLAQLGREPLALLRKDIERLREWPWTKWPPVRWPVRPKCTCAPLYEPDWWNDAAAGGARQYSNNCYNYGTNYRTDTFAQPGYGSGQMYGAITCAEVLAAAIRDDLINSPKANNHCPKEGHLVALVVGPHWDFHWYRKGRNGYWTHKPGGTAVTNLDNSGQLISDPRTADRGNYTDFCSFMVAMHGHTKIR